MVNNARQVSALQSSHQEPSTVLPEPSFTILALLFKLSAVLTVSKIVASCVAVESDNKFMPVESAHDHLKNSLNPLLHRSRLLSPGLPVNLLYRQKSDVRV